jgi:LysM repeat protein
VRVLGTNRILAMVSMIVVGGLLLSTPTRGADEIVVRRGDTLSGIAAAHGLTVADLVRWNQIPNPRLIFPGQHLVLHAPPTPPVPTPPLAPVTHVVARGETLSGIAGRFGTTVRALAAANDIANPSFIRTGQRLVIPGTVAATQSVAPASVSPPPAVALGRVHVVARGETLIGIAGRYGVTVSALASANQISNPSFIRTGQHLTIPGAGTATPPTTSAPALPATTAALMASRSQIRDAIAAAARADNIPVALALAVAWQESGWQQGVVSSAGAVGVMQLMPGSADWVARSMLGEAPRITDAVWNIRAGVRLLHFYLERYDGNRAKTLAAYYQGMTALERDGIYRSTQPYITSVGALEAMLAR